MGLLDRIRGGGKPSNSEQENQMVTGLANTQVLTRNQSSAQEAEDRQNKGIDFDMIYAEQAVQQLNDLAYMEKMEWQDVPELDDKGHTVYDAVPALNLSGNPILQPVIKNLNGTDVILQQPVLVPKPRIAKKLNKVVENHVWAMAALVYLDSVLPTIWMGSWEADTAKLYIRAAFLDIRQQMRADPLLNFQQKQECVVLLTAVRDLALFRLEDCKEGRKPLLLKVKREELGVHMSRGNVGGK